MNGQAAWIQVAVIVRKSQETVRRDFAASAVAALVVKQDTQVPAQVGNVQGIPHEAITIRELERTPDEGKL